MNLQDRLIDYGLLSKACNFYRTMGFHQVEVDWTISEYFSDIPRPEGADNIAFILQDNSRLLCSAEQGLIRATMLGKLNQNVGGYFSVSPCFRREKIDYSHSQTFMKLELFAIGKDRINWMTWCAKQFFEQNEVVTEILKTDIGQDLMYDGRASGKLELGSYGTRTLPDNQLITYGTGLALPRFTLAQEHSRGLSY